MDQSSPVQSLCNLKFESHTMDERQGMIIFPETYPEIDLRFEVIALMEDLKALKFGDLDQLSNLVRTTHALAQRDQIRKTNYKQNYRSTSNACKF